MFEKTERQAIYVWLYSMKWKRKLQRFGTIYYSSPKMKYVIMYINSDRVAKVKSELKTKKYVKRISMAHRKELDEHFAMKIPEKNSEREE
ncbi:YlbG family protein [Companilactobacillus versmoldensis]|uniref:Uncharacterized protein n=1 Tax=Companilactobacillus versmoldensis DSM 14857 = KCTC 3814 TaxID=1423815 RepID=A0A0R1SF69_9LACO|nr:YlbG family protein [Companilactobacillus versmoldensis]KRL67873.1 hypothetical protein FC27_GL001410 [Companilactobacillus versmoldensis DSM 14857 = KCTC 3814]